MGGFNVVKEKPSTTKRTVKKVTERKDAPALDPESREKQLINKAVILAERQLEDGTASAAVITHFLKLATEKERLERAKLEKENRILEVKASSITQANDNEKLAKEAIDAMKNYTSSSN